MAYQHGEIEKKWQQKWEQDRCFQTASDSQKPKYYALNMFPYPSGAGLHIGHIASYTPTDIIARYKRAKGFNVLHPMGYDAFGLPAEQYAIQTGIHPAETTHKAIRNFRRQLKSFGYSFDWDKETSTCDKKFYKWTQFIFLKLFERGLAYQKEVPVNWCPALRTVLANEEVVDGKSERGGHPVVRQPMKQWMLKITDYAERLLNDLDKVDWPEKTKQGQRNWIGKSEGAQVFFKVENFPKAEIEIFTTRPDTLFGVTFMVLAPEHPLVNKITHNDQKKSVEDYVAKTAARSEIDRKTSTEKTGVFTGAYALHPLDPTKKNPIWIADYVLMGYGTGAIMAVPGHDTRDFEFAKKFSLPIQRVIQSKEDLPFEDEGHLVNSQFLNGLNKSEAILKITQHLKQNQLGRKQVQYKLRDWLFSRQRYWGEPFPIIHFDDGQKAAVPYDELPVELPEVADYQPSEKGEPPLARNEDFVNYVSKKACKGQRETDTMPGSAGSSWYFLRYIDPNNNKDLVDFEKQKYWMPVDLYVGGSEHTVGHLLYARFWQKVLFDAGLTSYDEPFQKLAHQGVIMGSDGQRMSKSRGNVVNPDEVSQQYGADATRIYISFLGPFEKDKPWDSKGIDGVRRFLERVWRLSFDENNQCIAEDKAPSEKIDKLFHKTIKKVSEDIENMSFNTAISAMMILTNELYKESEKPKNLLKSLAQLLMPFAPHIAEELWQGLGGEGYATLHPWPEYDKNKVMDDTLITAVQVNGKTRGTVEVTHDTTQEQALELAQALTTVQNATADKKVIKIIFKPGRILNLIAK